MAILLPGKQLGSICTGFVWAPLQAGRLKRISSLQGFDATTIEYVSVKKCIAFKDFMCFRTAS
jgi:hypothetical protein